jgi:hypothetical protein
MCVYVASEIAQTKKHTDTHNTQLDALLMLSGSKYAPVLLLVVVSSLLWRDGVPREDAGPMVDGDGVPRGDAGPFVDGDAVRKASGGAL